ncbi:MAG: hypothetical protein QOF76_5443, partial [Solirubrobacteraceae bacterium]|nr:hypothetical protein [Solirubrobacteraceae bacterium]
VHSLQLNRGHCGDADGDIEIVSNSISSDETGGIYVVTSKLLDRVQWDGKNLSLKLAGHYNVGPPASGVRLGDGAGSTPHVMGTSRDKDRFVVITDGGPLMNLDLFWRDRIPKDWKPIADGKDRRLACEVPVTFGDPGATRSISEQSVLTNGYTSVVVNNALKDEAALNALPPAQRQIAAALAGQDPLNAPYGIERIDWSPRTRTCKPVWSNRDVSIPNAIPTLSTQSNMIYSQGQINGAWGLDGIDLATGEQTLRTEASALLSSNSLYAATEVGPDGAIWQGTAGGIDIYRGPTTAAPPKLRCFDLTPPTLTKLRVKTIKHRINVRARTGDRACGKKAPVRLRTTVDGRRRTAHLRKGRHRVRVIAVDRGGLVSRPKFRSIIVA